MFKRVAALIIICSIAFAQTAEAARIVIGVAPGETTPEGAITIETPERPHSEALNQYMREELQEYIWELCLKRYQGDELKRYYACMIGLAEGESEFKSSAYRANSDGTCDRGLYQINSGNIGRLKRAGLITGKDDLYDPYKSALCGEYIFHEGYKDTLYSEQAYTRYLYGDTKKRSNKYTRRVWNMMQKWYTEFWG